MENAKRNTTVSYLGPFITMVFLFFIVGFLTTANTQFQGPLKEAFLSKAGNLTNTIATLITFSWFLAYPVAGGIGAKWVGRFGYKGTLTRGILVMFLGLFFFWLSSWFTIRFPEAYLNMSGSQIPVGYFIFLLGSFIVGASATILQVVLNPYLSACDVKGTQPVQRLAIGGSSNSVGTTIAPYFVTGVVFGGVAMSDVKVEQLTVPFLSLMAVAAILYVIIRRLSLPDIEGTHAQEGEVLEDSVWSFRHLTLGVIAIFFYVGAEVCIGANINMYAIELDFSAPALLATLYWGGMLVGRLVGSSLSKVSPKVQLIVTTSMSTILIILAILLGNLWLLAAVGLFHSIMWGAIFTLSVNKLGKYTNAASGVFMIGVIGGAVFPLLQGLIADLSGGWRFSWLMVIVCELYMLYYAVWGSKVKKTAE